MLGRCSENVSARPGWVNELIIDIYVDAGKLLIIHITLSPAPPQKSHGLALKPGDGPISTHLTINIYIRLSHINQ